MKARAPIIGSMTPAARQIRRVSPRARGYSYVFRRNVIASGVIPQISVIAQALAPAETFIRLP